MTSMTEDNSPESSATPVWSYYRLLSAPMGCIVFKTSEQNGLFTLWSETETETETNRYLRKLEVEWPGFLKVG